MENRNILMGIISISVLFTIVFGIAVLITWPRNDSAETDQAEIAVPGSRVESWWKGTPSPSGSGLALDTESRVMGYNPDETTPVPAVPRALQEFPAITAASDPLETEPAVETDPVVTEDPRAVEREDNASGGIRIVYNEKRPAKPVVTVSPRSRGIVSDPAVLKKPAPPTSGPAPKRTTEYWIQAGSFKSRASAEAQNEKLVQKGFSGHIQTHPKDGCTYYRVRIGPYTRKGEAQKFLSWIKEIRDMEGSYISEVYVLR